MENRTKTMEDVLREVTATLKGISVPAELVDRIGIPVLLSIRNLENCLEAIAKNRQAEENERKEREQDEQRD